MNGTKDNVTDGPDNPLKMTIVEIQHSLLERSLTSGRVWRGRRKKFDFKVNIRMHRVMVVAQFSRNG